MIEASVRTGEKRAHYSANYAAVNRFIKFAKPVNGVYTLVRYLSFASKNTRVLRHDASLPPASRDPLSRLINARIIRCGVRLRDDERPEMDFQPPGEGDFEPKENPSLFFHVFSSSPAVPLGTASTSFGKTEEKMNGNGPVFPIHHHPRRDNRDESTGVGNNAQVFGFSDSGYIRCTNGMLDRLLIDHALVSLCDPVIGNRAVYSRYCQQRGRGGSREVVCRGFGTGSIGIYLLCAFHGEGVGIAESNRDFAGFNFDSNPNFSLRWKNLVALRER